MSKVVIRNKVLINSNKRYFRTGAEKMVLGSYGKKEKGLLSSRYLFRHHDVKIDKPDVIMYGPYGLDVEKTKKAEFDIPMDTSVANGSVNVSYDLMKSQKMVFMELYITPRPLIEALNKDQSILEYLRYQGKNARIVDCIFVAVEAEFYSQIDLTSDIEAKTTVKGIELSLKLKTGGGSKSKLTLAPNTTIAYGLVEPIWNNSKTSIFDFEPDLKGAG